MTEELKTYSLVKVEKVAGTELSSETHYGVWARRTEDTKWIQVEHFHGPHSHKIFEQANELADDLHASNALLIRYINMALD